MSEQAPRQMRAVLRPSLRDPKEVALAAGKLRDEQLRRESEQREHYKARLAELTALEAKFARAAGEVNWQSDPLMIAMARLQLQVVREIIASIPRAPEPPALTPEEQAARDLHNRISGLETVMRERRWQVALIRRDVLSAVDLKLSQPLDTRNIRWANGSRAASADDVAAANKRLRDQAEQAQFGSLRVQRAALLERIEALEAEAARAEEELRQLGVEA